MLEVDEIAIPPANFSIEVTPKNKNAQFGFKDLEMYHRDCQGGWLRQKVHPSFSDMWLCTCSRCGQSFWLYIHLGDTVSIINTAIDGQERIISRKRGKEKISVIQRKKTQ